MISVEEARKTILAKIDILPAEKVFITEAAGRCLAEDVISRIDVPPWDNSAMDGYAVSIKDIESVPARLSVSQDIPAGAIPLKLKKGTSAKIMTGAPVPEGADAVVMREDTEETQEWIVIKKKPGKNENIRFKGEDIKQGSVVLKKGTMISPAHTGLLASIRKMLVYCHQVPRIAVLSTGDEIGDLDEDNIPGKITSSNTYSLISLIRQAGGEPINLGIARDDKKHLEHCLSASKRADLIITSGGVSVGDYDLVKDVLTSGNNVMEFWKVAMKPGKPLAFGTIAGIPAIGLPGNPASVVVAFYQFVRPAIMKMIGSDRLLLPRIKARLNADVKKKADRPHYIRAKLSLWPEPSVMPFGEQGSGILSTMASSNCFIVLPKEVSIAEKDTFVECEIFNPLTL
jgi:molybdopterin molybdotransferase